MTKSDDAFRTISEVAKELDLATHVLRFWESKFPQIKPLKRAGGRRYYRPDDVALLRRLQSLLHDEGYTIKGVQKLLREDGARKLINEASEQDNEPQVEAEVQAILAPEAIEPDLNTDISAPAPETPTEAQSATPQASLFDMAPVEPQEDVSEPDMPIPEDMPEAPVVEKRKLTFTLKPNNTRPETDSILPDAPEPEPVRGPDEPAPKIIVKKMLTHQQRRSLEEVLAELKDIKKQIDQVA
ncbi:Uncharacterized HTH-type transcriptional regulator in himA 3'region (modular protein) [Candidatus Terasakiella magnetica]|uniref:Uncharacterized HTH-type transcriptional regulator in himA 3'region (Modular protein) n=1 Tax=Candidatus Terasakiella magnetica TaxID=1867952 RepID=A0A1C3RCY6_9PROT|nr:MerR family transcriptional regulator [Candidatus Terasakiella magnetica]SCA55136.1 Uncharacterized HTH-type transcriptional regulator in himA 3'region (modular protein) [Candidatus Terasakiella magnetica]